MRIAFFSVLAFLATVASPAAAPPPLESFAEQVPSPAPDYANAASWAARPGREGASGAVPPGATLATRNALVDVFYVNPTTYRSADRWNQDSADTAANAWTDASVIARQASVFNGCCRVFAPRYRQASTRSFTAMDGDGGKAFALAYSDVARAFEHYLKHDSRGRPFILAGHSQGAFHIARLVEERIDRDPALRRRMVAAYAIGYNLSEGDFGKTYRHVPVCAVPAQTGCIIQWNAMLDGPDLAKMRGGGEARYVARHGDDPGKTMLCINPLTFALARPVAQRGAARGAVPGDPGFGPLQPLRAGAVAARCADGQLIVDPDPALGLKPLPGGSMHYHDYGLFYADIRANAVLRTRAFLRRK